MRTRSSVRGAATSTAHSKLQIHGFDRSSIEEPRSGFSVCTPDKRITKSTLPACQKLTEVGSGREIIKSVVWCGPQVLEAFWSSTLKTYVPGGLNDFENSLCWQLRQLAKRLCDCVEKSMSWSKSRATVCSPLLFESLEQLGR
jgi:hypothetical protein